MDRLPRGRHGLSPEYVARNQREQLIAGLTEVLYEKGYQDTTVSLIGKRAAVSKSDFYKHFESKDDCFFAAYEAAIERLRRDVLQSCAEHREDPWPPRIRDALSVLLRTLAAVPIKPRAVRTKVGENSVSPVPVLNATKPRKATPQPRSALISSVWTQ